MLKAEVEEFDVTLRKDTSVADANKIAEGIKLDLYATKAGLISDLANDKMDLAGAEFTINGIPVKPENNGAAPAKLAKTPGGANSLVFKPVIKDIKNQYISLLKAGVYTITVKFEDGGKTYVSSTSVAVKNDTAKAEKDKSYKVEKINATNNMPYEDVTKAIVDTTDSAANTVDTRTLKDYSSVLAIKGGKATKVPNGLLVTLDALASEVFIDTAVLPSFRLDTAAGSTVWVLEEKLNQKVENLESGIMLEDFAPASVDFNQNTPMIANIKNYSIGNTGALAVDKIYVKGDGNKVDKQSDFTSALIGGTLAGNDAKVTVTPNAGTTQANTYVIVIKYTLAGKDYFAEKEFVINNAGITALRVKVDGVAPADSGAVNGIAVANISTSTLTPAASVDALVEDNLAFFNAAGATPVAKLKTAKWATGEKPQLVITFTAKANYEFKLANLNDVFDNSGVGMAAGYSATGKLEGGKLIITITKDAVL